MPPGTKEPALETRQRQPVALPYGAGRTAGVGVAVAGVQVRVSSRAAVPAPPVRRLKAQEQGLAQMSKKRRDRSRPQQPRRRSRPTTGHLRVVPTQPEGESPYEQELIQTLRRGLRARHPLDFLLAVSGILTVTDPRSRSPLERDKTPHTGLDALVESFTGVDIAETTAALTVIATLASDEVLAARIGKTLTHRDQPIPTSLSGLNEIHVRRVMTLTHILGDGDDYFVESSLPSGDLLTAMVYVDHNMGTIVKDAFVIDRPIDDVIEIYNDKVADPESTFADIDFASQSGDRGIDRPRRNAVSAGGNRYLADVSAPR